MKNKNIIIITFLVAILTAITMFFANPNNQVIQLLRIIFWSVFILFIPGYFLTLSFFKNKEIDFFERFALSFALSISIVPLLSFYFNLIGVKITELSVYLIVLFIILANIIYINFLWKKEWKTV